MANDELQRNGQDDPLRTVFVVISWFVLNISLANFTKWTFIYGEVCIKNHCQQYKFPLTITVVHMLFSWGLCHLYIFYLSTSARKVTLSFRQQLSKVVPLAACFALSVAMGNLSLKYIYPSFNQMLGAMTPLITVLISIPMGKCYNAWTWLSMPVICGGLALCSLKEVNFNFLGAFFAVGATVLRAVKSIIQGKLLVDPSEKMDSVTLLYYMAPYAAGLIGIAALCSEGLTPFTLLNPRLSWSDDSSEEPSSGTAKVTMLLFLGGLNACLLNITNFLVTAYTNAVTLQVLGNVKSCLGIAVSVAIFGNPLRPLQGLGMVICLVGVWAYQRYGGVVKKEELSERAEVSQELEALPGDPEATPMSRGAEATPVSRSTESTPMS
jgi:drug/metabolite transporter (DMT)-like permease